MITVPKFFNTAGPIKSDIHYNVDPLKRINLDEMMDLIHQQKYFILHAPRQTGKTSCLLALRDYLNAQGDYIAVYANVEAGQASRNNVNEVVRSTIGSIAERIGIVLGNDLAWNIYDELCRREGQINTMLTSFLKRLCESLPKPLLLFIDVWLETL